VLHIGVVRDDYDLFTSLIKFRFNALVENVAASYINIHAVVFHISLKIPLTLRENFYAVLSK
jgi:hypothetical protein